MYLAMMELFPTFWSPTKTTLNFCIEFLLLENEIWSFIFCFDIYYLFLNYIEIALKTKLFFPLSITLINIPEWLYIMFCSMFIVYSYFS